MNYRLYSLTNYYLSSLQKGLQTAHVVGEMSRREHDSSFSRPVKKIFRQWTDQDKTIILLNGGNNAGIKGATVFLSQFSDRYPVAAFQEDEISLAGASTATGIILPESVYTGQSEWAGDKLIYEFISKLSLAV